MNPNSRRYIGAGLILAALLPLSHGSRLLSAQNTFMQESTQHPAVVVEHALKTPQRQETLNAEVFSVVEFTDDTGARRAVRTNVASYPPAHTIGEEINVRVHRTRPEDVRVVSFSGLWLESAFFLMPGLLTLLLGIRLIINGKRNRK